MAEKNKREENEEEISEVQPETQQCECESPEQAEDGALISAKAEAEDFKRKWYSVTAEYENYRKRTASSRAQAYADGRADVVSKLFPIAEGFPMFFQPCAKKG